MGVFRGNALNLWNSPRGFPAISGKLTPALTTIGVSGRFPFAGVKFPGNIVGREAVVAAWLGESDSGEASTRDAPGTYSAHYARVAIDNDVVVAAGTSSFANNPTGPLFAFMTTAS